MEYIYKDGLESERLITKKLVPEDCKIWARFFEDSDCAEFLPNFFNEGPEDRSIRWINKQLLRYDEKTFGLQALIHRQTGAFIGQCGLLGQEVDGIQEVEVGYHVFKEYWGQGYAPEAAKLFLQYAFDNGLAESVISIIHVGNIKSQKVAIKNGLQREKVTCWNELDVAIYRVHKKVFH